MRAYADADHSIKGRPSRGRRTKRPDAAREHRPDRVDRSVLHPRAACGNMSFAVTAAIHSVLRECTSPNRTYRAEAGYPFITSLKPARVASARAPYNR